MNLFYMLELISFGLNIFRSYINLGGVRKYRLYNVVFSIIYVLKFLY